MVMDEAKLMQAIRAGIVLALCDLIDIGLKVAARDPDARERAILSDLIIETDRLREQTLALHRGST
jgi:hypothetical protein